MTSAPTSECRALLASISAYLDGDLDATRCASIERHCNSCPHCAAVVDGLRRTVGLCREAGRAPLPEEVRERARASIQRLLGSR